LIKVVYCQAEPWFTHSQKWQAGFTIQIQAQSHGIGAACGSSERLVQVDISELLNIGGADTESAVKPRVFWWLALAKPKAVVAKTLLQRAPGLPANQF
jgi:hypothetical protein